MEINLQAHLGNRDQAVRVVEALLDRENPKKK